MDLRTRFQVYKDRIAELEGQVEYFNSELSLANEALRHIYEDDIPTLLHEAGLTSAPLDDGTTITLEQVCNVKVADKSNLAAWLEGHEYDSIVKTALEFPKGTDMSEITSRLDNEGIDYSKSLDIHPMSLKKVMKEHIASGGEYPPEDVAEVTIFERAKIKEAK